MEFDDDEPEQPPQSFLRRYRIGIAVTGAVLVVIIIFAKFMAGGGGSSRHESIVMVNLPPPPPVRTPPPPPPPPQEEQKTEQPMIKEEQPKAESKPKDEPPIGTGIKGNGPDSFGLSNKEGSGRIGGGGSGTKWSWYAREVQTQVQQALQQNRKTRTANLAVNVRIWPNAVGRITRAQVAGSTGDPTLDTALSDALTGLQLPDPPPSDMPSPITLRVTERRPH